MAVTDWHATTRWPKHGTVLSHDKSWVLAMLAAKRRLRASPAAMPGRDEGTGASIEPWNSHEQGLWPCCHAHASHTVVRPMVGETEHASHTEIRTSPPDLDLVGRVAWRQQLHQSPVAVSGIHPPP